MRKMFSLMLTLMVLGAVSVNAQVLIGSDDLNGPVEHWLTGLEIQVRETSLCFIRCVSSDFTPSELFS
jgi:hypothetical protein